MTDKSKPTEAEIRQRAHEIWEREGRPEFRDQEHWRKAEAELAAAGPQGNEGEGSKTAALATSGLWRRAQRPARFESGSR